METLLEDSLDLLTGSRVFPMTDEDDAFDAEARTIGPWHGLDEDGIPPAVSASRSSPSPHQSRPVKRLRFSDGAESAPGHDADQEGHNSEA